MNILRILPHRFPFLMIDKLVQKDSGKNATAIKNISQSELAFLGHFPNQPIFPGVLLLEAMAQTCACIHERKPNEIFVLAGINNAVFRKPVIPGDQLYIYAKSILHKLALAKFEVEIHVENKIVASAHISGFIVPQENP